MCVTTTLVHQDTTFTAKRRSISISKNLSEEAHSPILPGLPDDIAKHCLGLVPRSHFPAMASVCKRWRSFMTSKEFITVRKLAGALEEWLYFLTVDAEGYGPPRWEVLDRTGRKQYGLPPMPGPVKSGSGIVVLDGKLMVIAGRFDDEGTESVSSDLYQYDSCVNSWKKLASMNVARYDFACAEVNGLIYAVGGCGANGESLSCAEAYDPETDRWAPIEGPRRPRRGCFACGFEGKLYVMGGRSDFTIGNSRSVDAYDPERRAWSQRTKNGCAMVTAHAVLGERLCFVEWKNERSLAMLNFVDGCQEKVVRIPLRGGSRVGFRFGVLDGKLLLFSSYGTLSYDPKAAPGSEWGASEIKPSGSCLRCFTVKA